MSEETKKTALLSDFAPISTAQWEAQIEKDLKGADPQKLVWRTLEGINLKPYHRSEDIESLPHVGAKAGCFPFVRGNSANNNAWEIRQDIRVFDTEDANRKALEIMYKGVDSIGFNTINNAPAQQKHMHELLQDIHPECVSINFVSGNAAPRVLSMFYADLELKQSDTSAVRGSIDYDPYGYVTETGHFSHSEEESIESAYGLVAFAKRNLPQFRVLNVDAQIFHNAGSNAVQELAFAMAMGNEYLAKLTDKGLLGSEIAAKLQFTFAVGSNYFMEIAKIRAARYLWAQIVKTYGAAEEDCKAYIHSVTSKWNQTIYDPNVNMLRNTTEAMSAVIGGTDSLTVLPHNTAYEKTSDFSERIARNVQILLKEESYLDKVVDPAGGSYYIETLTSQLIENAWALFKEVENKGGYFEALKAGFIQDQVNAMGKKRAANLATRRQILLGTNQYPNGGEKIASTIDNEIVRPLQVERPNPIVSPLVEFRGAEAFEKLRLATETSGTNVKAYMLTYGNLGMRKARAMFACNFFAVAGFETVDNNGFASATEGAKAALEAQAQIVVLCSSDEEYLELAREARAVIGDKALIVVAGNPESAAEIAALGVTDFIHVRTNVLESLTDFQKRVLKF
jgi:methylmalonyl-CoA mutase